MFGMYPFSYLPIASSDEMLFKSNGEIISLTLSVQNVVNVSLSIQK